MTDADGADRSTGGDRSTGPDLNKYPSPPAADAEYWQPYDPYTPYQADPLAALDQLYPPYPVAYPSSPFPGPYSPNPYLMAPHLTAPPKTNAMSTAAMVCSLVAIPGVFMCFGVALAPVGVVLGIIGLGQIRDRPNESGDAQAWTGIIVGGLLTLFCVLIGVLWFAFALDGL
ncbi:DUF4190 domain-containing protein [Williamsia soli]|uniref:DUF4190 domain-containing protein n=1 Tax=Williamsia soli TaxID=364929 RepID=UPI001A9E4157|nr:DUF4190 domain-containing protein [Williamsia soli]